MMDLDSGDSDIPRFPIYFVVGTSHDFTPVMEQVISLFWNEFCTLPQAVGSIWMSLLTYDSKAHLVTPLTSLEKTALGNFPVLDNDAALGAGLALLVSQIRREICIPQINHKGDYRPLVMLFVDRDPTDDWNVSLRIIEQAKREQLIGTLVAFAIGSNVNLAILRYLTESVFEIEDVKMDFLRGCYELGKADRMGE